MAKKSTIWQIVLSFVLLFSQLLTGCASDDSPAVIQETPTENEQITLSIYAQYSQDDTRIPYDYAVDKLKEEYPDVTLNLIVQAEDDGETLETLAAIGQLPDIFQANTNIINMLRKNNQIMQLDEIAESSGFLDKLYPRYQDMIYSDDGHMYCFPYAGDEYVLCYYNKTLFEQCGLKAPATFEELLHCIEVFRQNNIVPLALFGQEGWVTAAMYDAIATRFVPGGIRSLDQQETTITDGGYVTAAEILSQLAKAGLFQANVTNTNYEQASKMFLNGEAAMFLNGQWYIPEADQKMKEDVDWMFFPALDAKAYETGKTAFVGGGSNSGYAVNPDGEHARLAGEVAEFLSEKYCEAKVMFRGNPMVTLDTGAEPVEDYQPMMQKLYEIMPQITSATIYTWGLEHAVLNESIMANTQGLVSGEYSPAEFTANVSDAISKMKE